MAVAMKKSLGSDLTRGSVAKKMLVFAFPLMLSNLLQIIYGMVDMIVVGQYVGSVGLSAVSNGADIMGLVTMLCMGFTSAGQVVISQYVGRGEAKGVSRAIGTMFSLMAMLSVISTVVGFILVDWLMVVLNVPAEAAEQARVYSQICFGGTVFIIGYNMVSSILRGMGDSKRPFVFVAIAAVINLVFDLIFVAGMGMGSAGAAWATVLGQAFSFVASMIYLYIKREEFGFDFKAESFKPDFKIMFTMIKLGIPMALSHSAVALSKMFVNSFLNSYGVAVSAVNGVGNKIGHVNTVITGAIGMACVAMVGQNFGAGNHERVKKTIYTALACSLSATIPFAIIVMAFPEGVFSVFNSDPEVLAWAPTYAWIALIQFISAPLRNSLNGIIQGTGNARLGLISGIMDGIVARAGLAYLMGVTMDMGIVGFWLGGALAGFIPFVMGGIYFWSGLWTKHKAVVD